MSEQRDDDNGLLALQLLFFAVITGAIIFAYLEADSWIQRSQLRDLQRRVGQIESRQQR